MKAIYKSLLAVLSIIVSMLIIPCFIPYFINDLGLYDIGMALYFLLFFAIYPAVVFFLGLMAGTETKKLWWIPLLCALAFPFLFGIAVKEMLWDLFAYSGIYLGIGLASMLGMHYGIKIKSQGGKNNHDIGTEKY